MFSAFTNSLKIPELRSRIFYTLALLFVARVGAVIPLPGIDPHPLQNFFADQTASGGGALVLRPLPSDTSGAVGFITGAFTYAEGAADRGNFSLALRREKGVWKIVADMDNPSGMPGR